MFSWHWWSPQYPCLCPHPCSPYHLVVFKSNRILEELFHNHVWNPGNIKFSLRGSTKKYYTKWQPLFHIVVKGLQFVLSSIIQYSVKHQKILSIYANCMLGMLWYIHLQEQTNLGWDAVYLLVIFFWLFPSKSKYTVIRKYKIQFIIQFYTALAEIIFVQDIPRMVQIFKYLQTVIGEGAVWLAAHYTY